MNRPAAAMLLALIAAGLLGCGSAGDDPAQANVVEKPVPMAPTKE